VWWGDGGGSGTMWVILAVMRCLLVNNCFVVGVLVHCGYAILAQIIQAISAIGGVLTGCLRLFNLLRWSHGRACLFQSYSTVGQWHCWFLG
jgi:hypothetical protein